MDTELYQRFYEIEERFWWSVGTRRVFFQLIDSVHQGRGGRALDVGCGTGIMMREFPPGWDLVAGCDYSELALSFSHQRGLRGLVRCDATQLPFATDSLDLVTALDVIEHLDGDQACVREIVRACRPGGHVLIHVPAFQILWSDKDDLNHHRRRYHWNELVALVEDAGLVIERMFYINIALFPVAFLRALVQRAVGGGQRDKPTEASATVDHLYQIPETINRLMIAVMDIERHIVTRWPIPFGMSMVCLARKPTP